MRGWGRAYVKAYLRLPLVVLRAQVVKYLHLVNETKGERREVITTGLTSGHHEDV